MNANVKRGWKLLQNSSRGRIRVISGSTTSDASPEEHFAFVQACELAMRAEVENGTLSQEDAELEMAFVQRYMTDPEVCGWVLDQ